MLAARWLYQLSHARKSGTLRITRPDRKTASVFAELRQGWVHAVELSPAYAEVGVAPSTGEERLRLFVKLAADSYSEHQFADNEPSARRGGVTPFHPAVVVRNLVDAALSDAALFNGSYLRVKVGLGTVCVPEPPHASCLGQDERPLLGYLSRPRSFAELDGSGLSAPERAGRLLAFIDTVGALTVAFAAADSPFTALELADGASEDEVKSAFRRLARELHPDRHPGAPLETLRALERRFAEVSAAYRRLV